MLTPAPAPNLAPLMMVPLFAWSIYRRISSQFGRQGFSSRRITIRLVILAIVSAALIALAIAKASMILPIAGGLACGAVIALVNLKLTRFERTPEGDFYYPHPYVGAALSLLLVARLAWRYSQLAALQGAGSPPPTLFQSPLTIGLLTLLVGYYAVYACGLLILRGRQGPIADQP